MGRSRVFAGELDVIDARIARAERALKSAAGDRSPIEPSRR